jgi:hypothetical protein
MGISQQTTTYFWHVDLSDPFTAWILQVAGDPNPPLVNSISYGSVEQV